MSWNDVAGYLAIVLSVVTLWTGLKKPDLSAFWKFSLYILDLLLILWGVVSLGWYGLGFLLVANLVAAAGWGLWLAVNQQDILAQAAIASRVERTELENLQRRLRDHRVVRQLRPLDQSRMIRYIAERNRGLTEIEQMAVPVATLWVIYRPDVELPQLIEDFDRLLRIWRIPAKDAMSMADKLVAATQHTAGGYRDVVDGLLAFGDLPQ